MDCDVLGAGMSAAIHTRPPHEDGTIESTFPELKLRDGALVRWCLREDLRDGVSSTAHSGHVFLDATHGPVVVHAEWPAYRVLKLADVVMLNEKNEPA
jgi:hypothetical protein